MLKSELRSLIKNLLPKAEEINRYHDNVVDRAIAKALNEFYNVIYLRNPLELQRYTYGLGYTTPVPVALEASTGLYYSNFPTGYTPVVFPDKASGVRRISTPTQGGTLFHPMDARELDLVPHGHYVDGVTGTVGYVVRRTRVEYYNIPVAIVTSGVRMDCIIPFTQYTDTEYVPLPELTGNEGQGLIDRILLTLGQVRPVELHENKSFEEGK